MSSLLPESSTLLMQSDKSFGTRSRFRNYTTRSRACYIRWGIISLIIAVILALTLSLTLTLGKSNDDSSNIDGSPSSTSYTLGDDMVLDKNFVAEGVNNFGNDLFVKVANNVSYQFPSIVWSFPLIILDLDIIAICLILEP